MERKKGEIGREEEREERQKREETEKREMGEEGMGEGRERHPCGCGLLALGFQAQIPLDSESLSAMDLALSSPPSSSFSIYPYSEVTVSRVPWYGGQPWSEFVNE
jgi:hypothetical protein